MFTGIVEGTGRVASLRRAKGHLQLTIRPDFRIQKYTLGESIAVNGVCLTVASVRAASFTTDLGKETQRVTTLGRLKTGDRVNLERPVRLSDRLGGHLVQGHVDGVGRILKIERGKEGSELWIALPQKLKKYVILKGSITVEGVSLTVNRLQASSFSIFLIPHTLNVTTLGGKKARNPVNLEVDIIGKYMESLLS